MPAILIYERVSFRTSDLNISQPSYLAANLKLQTPNPKFSMAGPLFVPYSKNFYETPRAIKPDG